MSKVDLDRFNDFMVEYKKEITKDYEEEIERLTNDLEREKSQVKEYGTRLLKAIEILENEPHLHELLRADEILNILQGGTKE